MKVGSRLHFTRWLLLAALVASLLVYRPGDAGAWWQALFEWLHVPVFAGITAIAYFSTPTGLGSGRRVAYTLALSAGLAILTEVAQIPMARSAELSDVVSDLAGSAIALFVVLAAGRKDSRRFVLAAAAAGLTAATLTPLARTTWAFHVRDTYFPIVFKGNTHNEAFVTGQGAALGGGFDSSRQLAFTEVTFLDERWPGIEIHDLHGDWRPYDTMTVQLTVEEGGPVDLVIRVHDRRHRSGQGGYGDRFNRTFALVPGLHTLEIPIAEIRSSPAGREMDLNQVDAIFLFTTREFAGRRIRLYEVRLD